MTNAWVFFAGDICWGKCRSRKGKTRSLTGGRAVHLCDECFGIISPSHMELLAVKV